MSGPCWWGTYRSRKYEGHPEASRKALFAKDREIRRISADLERSRSTLDFIAAVADGKVGGSDPAWQVATILEALTPEVRQMAASR